MTHRRFITREPDALVTSARVERRGAHDHLSVWVRSGLAGTFIVPAGDGARMAALMQLIEQHPEETDDA